MSCGAVTFFLLLLIGILTGIILYQRFVFRTGIETALREMSKKLKEIGDRDSGEPIMVFTENRELMELAAQINRMLDRHLKAKADYRRSEIAYKKMLSNISHDIKTPMTVILGYLEILGINRANPEAGAGGAERERPEAGAVGLQLSTDEMLGKMRQKAEQVMELVNQFFTLAKLESGDMDLELSRIDACELCRGSVLDFYEILTGHDFQVDIRLPEGAVWVQGNKEALGRILSNLISNVIRYGADGKYLAVALRADEKTVCIDVTDRGKGIEHSFADRVFDRLFTMEDSRSRSIQGNGLGLTIAKNLARQMGGDLTLDSIPRVSTTFTVALNRWSY